MTLIVRIATVMLILSWSLQASAQADPDFAQKALYSSKYYKYKNMKTVGMVLTGTGLVLGIVGISKMSNAPQTYNPSTGQTVATGPDAETGAWMFLLSVPMVGAGVPLAIVGSVKSKKYNALLEKTLINGRVTPQGAGLSLTYKF